MMDSGPEARHPLLPARPGAELREEVRVHTYETLFITPPTLTEAEERETVDGLLQVVTDGGGSLVANERMGRRRLAYPILKHNDGVYVRFLYDAEPAVPKELERRVRISDRLLRSLTVRLEPNRAVAAKEQAVIDAKARIEAAEREKEQAEKEAAEREIAEKEAAERAAAAAVEASSETAELPEEEADEAAPADESAPADKSGSENEVIR
jgi:small subunit ribosomal protein S6